MAAWVYRQILEAPELARGPSEARDVANFTGLVLGCIETKFCK